MITWPARRVKYTRHPAPRDAQLMDAVTNRVDVAHQAPSQRLMRAMTVPRTLGSVRRSNQAVNVGRGLIIHMQHIAIVRLHNVNCFVCDH